MRLTPVLPGVKTVCGCALALVLAAATLPGALAAETKAPASPAPAAQTPAIQRVDDNEWQERLAFRKGVRALVFARDFDKLDTTAKDLRTSKARFSDSTWKLREFYSTFREYPERASDADWTRFIAAVVDWTNQKPLSTTARVALAETYAAYAWKARTSYESAAVTPEGWRLMQERLSLAAKALESAKPLPERCPGWYVAMQRVALGAGAPKDAAERLFEDAIRSFPDYDMLYGQRTLYLYPRWYGEPGEWERFIESMMKRKGIPDAAEIYAKVAIYLDEKNYFFSDFSRSRRSWELLKGSFQALQKHYPGSLRLQTIYLRACVTSYDYQEGRKVLAEMGDRFDPNCWKDEASYRQFVAWLKRDDADLAKGEESFRKKYH